MSATSQSHIAFCLQLTPTHSISFHVLRPKTTQQLRHTEPRLHQLPASETRLSECRSSEPALLQLCQLATGAPQLVGKITSHLVLRHSATHSEQLAAAKPCLTHVHGHVASMPASALLTSSCFFMSSYFKRWSLQR